jgi:uncharacterized protein (DUF1330 family)
MHDVTQGLTARYGTPDQAYLQRLADTPPDQDGPLWMVNLMRYREHAEYADGRPTELSGRAADDLYAPLEQLAALGAEVVLFGEVESQLLGEQPPWDRVAVVKYPSHRAFVELMAQPGYAELHEHKDAGMAATIILGAQPFAPPTAPPDAPELDQVPHPSTPEDPAVVVVHLIAFDRSQADLAESIEHMTAYQEHAARIAVPHGVRIAGWFDVEGVAVGDGRQWDQVRFNAFPSRAAFMAVVFDPERLAAQAEHRETAMSDTYTLIVRPLIDRLADSWADADV